MQAARLLPTCPDFRIALGVELLKNEVKVVAVNLYGKSIARDSFSETYTDTPEYYQMICDKILIFARALPCESSQILGIGFAMQALISADKKSILYGKDPLLYRAVTVCFFRSSSVDMLLYSRCGKRSRL